MRREKIEEQRRGIGGLGVEEHPGGPPEKADRDGAKYCRDEDRRGPQSDETYQVRNLYAQRIERKERQRALHGAPARLCDSAG